MSGSPNQAARAEQRAARFGTERDLVAVPAEWTLRGVAVQSTGKAWIVSTARAVTALGAALQLG